MVRKLGIVSGILVAASIATWATSAAAAQPELEPEPGVVPEPGGDAGTEPGGETDLSTEPDPEPEPDPPALEFEEGTDSEKPPSPSSSVEADSSDEGIRPFKGRFGLGVIRTIAGLNGINLRYFVTDRFALGANIGVALFTFRENDPTSTDVCPGPDCDLENTRTVAAIAASIEALYYAKLGKTAGRLPFRADFGLGGRFGFMEIVNAQDVADNLDDATELHIELPFIIQLMFGENFALAPEFGIDFRIVPGDRADPGDSNPGTGRPGSISPGDPGATSGPGFGFDITPGIGLFGGASMHYYF